MAAEVEAGSTLELKQIQQEIEAPDPVANIAPSNLETDFGRVVAEVQAPMARESWVNQYHKCCAAASLASAFNILTRRLGLCDAEPRVEQGVVMAYYHDIFRNHVAEQTRALAEALAIVGDIGGFDFASNVPCTRQDAHSSDLCSNVVFSSASTPYQHACVEAHLQQLFSKAERQSVATCGSSKQGISKVRELAVQLLLPTKKPDASSSIPTAADTTLTDRAASELVPSASTTSASTETATDQSARTTPSLPSGWVHNAVARSLHWVLCEEMAASALSAEAGAATRTRFRHIWTRLHAWCKKHEALLCLSRAESPSTRPIGNWAIPIAWSRLLERVNGSVSKPSLADDTKPTKSVCAMQASVWLKGIAPKPAATSKSKARASTSSASRKSANKRPTGSAVPRSATASGASFGTAKLSKSQTTPAFRSSLVPPKSAISARKVPPSRLTNGDSAVAIPSDRSASALAAQEFDSTNASTQSRLRQMSTSTLSIASNADDSSAVAAHVVPSRSSAENREFTFPGPVDSRLPRDASAVDLDHVADSSSGIGSESIETSTVRYGVCRCNQPPLAVLKLSLKDSLETQASQWDTLKQQLLCSDTVLLYHLRNHYAIIFAAREVEPLAPSSAVNATGVALASESSSSGDGSAGDAITPARLLRQVLTARKGQAPKHWIDFEEVRQNMCSRGTVQCIFALRMHVCDDGSCVATTL